MGDKNLGIIDPVFSLCLEASLELIWENLISPFAYEVELPFLVPSEIRFGHVACFVQRNQRAVDPGRFWQKFQEPVWNAARSPSVAVWRSTHNLDGLPSAWSTPQPTASSAWTGRMCRNESSHYAKPRRVWNCLRLLYVLAHCHWFNAFRSKT